ncbi:MAG: metallophosphoesterase [Verrucomicrobia subdivision 3 bacterium]|nr:metallophosphoesterase [Limisphaerales bacterium]
MVTAQQFNDSTIQRFNGQARLEVAPGLWLDARRAVWLERSRTLAVADLHIGYAWAHRCGGQLLPINVPDNTTARLAALQRDYCPNQIVLVGDVVHRALPVPPLRDAFQGLLNELASQTKVILVAGNHDRDLQTVFSGEVARITVADHFSEERCLFLHGDEKSVIASQDAIPGHDWLVIGHEHPCVTLDDGAATWQKYPCFLVGRSSRRFNGSTIQRFNDILVLPAFSPWAAGNSRDDYMSPLLQAAEFTLKVAILGDRLVPVQP